MCKACLEYSYASLKKSLDAFLGSIPTRGAGSHPPVSRGLGSAFVAFSCLLVALQDYKRLKGRDCVLIIFVFLV